MYSKLKCYKNTKARINAYDIQDKLSPLSEVKVT